jgi:hypothetical protein
MSMLNRLRRWRGRLRFLRLRYRIGGKRRYVTCAGKVDGAGAQAQAVVSVMLFARAVGAQYVHTPFSVVDHNPDSSPDWPARWERFFNFGQGEMPVSALDARGIARLQVVSPFEVTSPGVLYELPHCYPTWSLSRALLPPLLAELRGRFLAGKRVTESAAPALRVAIHVRRGDVTPAGPHARRFTASETVLRLSQRLDEALGSAGLPYRATLYSQGDPAQFQLLADRGVTIDTRDDPFETFLQLVTADVLVTAKSSFSYLAGLLSRGVVLYEPFWHAPLVGWVRLSGDGGFDRMAFLDRLAASRLGGSATSQHRATLLKAGST